MKRLMYVLLGMVPAVASFAETNAVETAMEQVGGLVSSSVTVAIPIIVVAAVAVFGIKMIPKAIGWLKSCIGK